MDIEQLLDAAAQAAVEHHPEVPDHLRPGSDARTFVWDRHYSTGDIRRRLDARLASETPEFRAAVTEAEELLADELAIDNDRLAAVRAEYKNVLGEQ